jgi:uncharacterized protein (DUF2141 family)
MSLIPSKPLPLACVAALAACVIAAPAAVRAAELEVRVTGVTQPQGQVGCWLYANQTGFPLESAGARIQWVAADPKGVTCRFTGVAEGRYALSVGHDLNGNQRVDTDRLGRPNEPWGVTQNVRPTFRAPRFDEAAFSVPAGDAKIVIDVKVAQ